MTKQNESDQLKMFGETIETMRACAGSTCLTDPFDLVVYAAMILSDAQEVMSRGDHESARQFVNKAKYFMAEATSILRRES